MGSLDRVVASPQEVAAAMPGDDVVTAPDVVMDRAFTLPAPPSQVWPWLVQLGKDRAGWYLPRAVERLVPRPRRAIRHLDPRWQALAVGDVVPDYGGRRASFTAHDLVADSTLVYTSRRGRTDLSWAILLAPLDGDRTRVRLRLRIAPVEHVWLAGSLGGLFDLLTIAGMAAGLDERVARGPTAPG